VVTAEKDANVAKLKLLVSEKTKIEHISEIAFYLYLDNLLELGDTTNETILSKLLGDVNMINDPILLLQIQSNDDQLKKSDRRERDEAIMGHLMSLVGDCRTSGRMKTEERGFQGTMLHSAPTRKNLSNGPVVEVID
jgi:aconitase B